MKTEDNITLTEDDAQQALDVVKRMEKASLEQSIPPKWFGIAMALMVGTLVFTIAEGLRDYYFFPIIAIPLIFAVRKNRAQALPITMPVNGKGVIATISLIAIFLALIAGGRILKEIYEMAWSPLIAGLIAVAIVYFLSVIERNEYLEKIRGE